MTPAEKKIENTTNHPTFNYLKMLDDEQDYQPKHQVQFHNFFQLLSHPSFDRVLCYNEMGGDKPCLA